MKTFNPKPFFRALALGASLLSCALLAPSPVEAQSQTPLSSEELVRLVRQLPSRPALKDALVNEIRRRGIGFPLTSGLLSIVATKSGNDALLRRTLEEAERRRANPEMAALPSEAESRKVLSEARTATLAATEAMPDFVVKQQIVRSVARGLTKNWTVLDRLTIAVSFRASSGEQYRVLAVNGLPTGATEQESGSYRQLGGSSSTGEFVSRLAALFSDESQTDFKAIDTDTLRGRRTVVYEYEIKQANSRSTISYQEQPPIIVGTRGRVWIDREAFRVLRLEIISTDIPAGFPVSASTSMLDYEWVNIAERPYLLPSRAVLEMTADVRGQTVQTRNDIRFRNYQKFGSEIRIIDEDIIDEEEQKNEQKSP